MKVLFINNIYKQCGVYQYGLRIYEILQPLGISPPQDIEYIYREIHHYAEYIQALSENPEIQYVIYNYHQTTISWLNTNNIQRKVKNIGIIHESPDNLFDIVIQIEPDSLENNRHYSIPRPIFENIHFSEVIVSQTRRDFIQKYTDTSLPIFGSFGFGFEFKGFEKIIQNINEQYEEAIIKFVIPVAHYDGNYNRINEIHNSCFSFPRKPGIKLMITHEFFTNTELLQFLHSNTMNIFLYDTLQNRSISSTIDYALSVKKPLGISDSHMFRHIYDDSICVYKTPIATIMENSVEYCKVFVEKYSHDNMRAKFREILLANSS